MTCVALVAACLATPYANADLSVTDGATSFFWNTDAGGTSGNANFVEPFGGSDLQYGENWYLRHNGTTYQLVGPTTQVGSGNTGAVTFNGVASVLLGFEGFDVEISYTITESGNQALLATSATVTNLSGTAQDVSLFNYFDYDVAGAGGNLATSSIDGTGVTINVTNPGAGQVTRTGIGASHFQVGSYAGLVNGLDNGTITTLSDGLADFGPGDFTGAIQWDLSVGANGSSTVFGSVSGTTAAVPEPSTFGLLAVMSAGLGFVGVRRRQRAKAEAVAE